MKLAEAMSLVNRARSQEGNPFRVVLACGFTPQHAHTFLAAHLAQRMPQRKLELRTGTYGDLLGTLERIETGGADAVAVVIEWEDLDSRLGMRSSFPWRLESMGDILATVERQLDLLHDGLQRISAQLTVAVALPTLPLPPCFKPALAWADPCALSLQSKMLDFAAAISTIDRIRLVNPQRLDQLSPLAQRRDLKSELRWGFPYSLEHASILGELLAQLLAPRAPKKAIISDLDDTMWRGILGEDGVEGVSWTLDKSSHGHALYQRMLAALADVGVLIGVASKNNPELVERVLARKDLIVPASAIFPVEAHWSAKSESVDRILQAWNIGPESVVFIDNDELEIAEVIAAFPEIQGLLFPMANDGAIAILLETLRDLFGKASVTREDQLRTSSVRANKQRINSDTTRSSHEILAQAEAEITLDFGAPDERAFELVNKTNQFNLNGRRIDECAWRKRLADPRCFSLSISYQDKFGPLGKIAFVSGVKDVAAPVIDVWVMSCRAFSRRIEQQTLKSLFEYLDCAELRLDLAATERNGPIQEFVTAIGGVPDGQGALVQRSHFIARCPPLYAKVILA